MKRLEIYYGPSGPGETEERFTANSFLDFLRRSNPVWQPHNGPPHEQHWVYRGHQNADWKLVPSAARLGNEKIQPFLNRRRQQLETEPEWQKTTDIHKHIVANIAAYADAMRFFMVLGNDLGQIDESAPGDVFEANGVPKPCLSTNGEPILSIADFIALGTMPPSSTAMGPYPGSQSAIAALAQHHGVPTFLLDWSRNPWTAAFFALNRQRDEKEQAICVWALNIVECKQVGQLAAVNGLGSIEFNDPPKSTNVYLNKQQGSLTYLADDRGHWLKTGDYPSLETIVSGWTQNDMREHDAYSQPGVGGPDGPANQERVISRHFKEERPILRKIVLSKDHVPELRQLLRREGITRAHLMPTLDNIASTALELAIDDL